MITALAHRAARPTPAGSTGHRIGELAHAITVYLGRELARHDIDRLADVTGLPAQRLRTVADLGTGTLPVADYDTLCAALGLDPVTAAEAAATA